MHSIQCNQSNRWRMFSTMIWENWSYKLGNQGIPETWHIHCIRFAIFDHVIALSQFLIGNRAYTTRMIFFDTIIPELLVCCSPSNINPVSTVVWSGGFSIEELVFCNCVMMSSLLLLLSWVESSCRARSSDVWVVNTGLLSTGINSLSSISRFVGKDSGTGILSPVSSSVKYSSNSSLE